MPGAKEKWTFLTAELCEADSLKTVLYSMVKELEGRMEFPDMDIVRLL